jgi:SAM-dependent methyltransferase
MTYECCFDAYDGSAGAAPTIYVTYNNRLDEEGIPMKDRPGNSAHAEIVDYERRAVHEHHHRGKSSESLLDKAAILGALRIEPGQTILDAGCGNGYMSKEFSKRVGDTGRVYALDPDEISIATLRAETAGTNIRAVVGDITGTTGLPAAGFDLVYLSTVVHGFSREQFKGFEAEAKRLLSPQGRLAVVEIVKRATPFGPPLDRRLSPEELKSALRLAPLATIDLGEYFYLQVLGRTPEGGLPEY